MALGDEWWCPYLAEENLKIEQAFCASADDVEVNLPGMDRSMRIKFTRDQSFALQRDDARHKERAVRRMVKTIQDVKVMLDRMTNPPLDVAELAARVPEGTIPHHFICPIFQDVMNDPVKTVDGHTYDRPAIERWLSVAATSPLTGLPLPSTHLEPNPALREAIASFLAANASPHPTAAAAAGTLAAAGIAPPPSS